MAERTDFERLGKEVTDAGRNLWLAGLGVMAELQTEGKKLFDTLVERGAEFDKGQVQRFEKKLGNRVDAWRDQLEHRVEGAVTGTMKRFGMPTREDLEALSARLETLSSKIDQVTAR